MNIVWRGKVIEVTVKVGSIRRKGECYTLPIVRRGGDEIDDSGSGEGGNDDDDDRDGREGGNGCKNWHWGVLVWRSMTFGKRVVDGT
jgi:hypothetical protein